MKEIIYLSQCNFYFGGSASHDGTFKSVTIEDISTVKKLYSVLSLSAFGFKITIKTRLPLA